VRSDGFKTYPVYYKVMEAFFTVVANLLNIEAGTTDGFKLNAAYSRDVYERGIRDLGELLKRAEALRPSIPEDRRYFFDYEFADAIRIIRGVYALSIATQDAIDRLARGDRAGALAALLDARPLTEELVAAFRHDAHREVALLVPQRNERRFLSDGQPVPAGASAAGDGGDGFRHRYRAAAPSVSGQRGDARPRARRRRRLHSQAERIGSSVCNGSPYSLTAFPLRNAFQIGGVRSSTASGRASTRRMSRTRASDIGSRSAGAPS
jgi:hypothetical protein